MIERDVVGANTSLTAEDKEKSNQEALRIANDAIQKKHAAGFLSQEELMTLSDDDLVKRMVEISDRGLVNYRLMVHIDDPNWYGEWHSNDPRSIAEAEMMGFMIDDRFAPKHGLHSDGTGKPIVGDVIHMICPTRIKNARDAAAKVRYERVHGRRTQLPEETNFESQVREIGLGTKFKNTDINQSTNERVSQAQILQTIKGAN